jgi:hypothetical protein
MRMLCIAAAVLLGVAWGGTAKAGSLSGNYLATVTKSRSYNGAHCLSLQDDGSLGWKL